MLLFLGKLFKLMAKIQQLLLQEEILYQLNKIVLVHGLRKIILDHGRLFKINQNKGIIMKNYLSMPLLITSLLISNIIVIPTKAITIGTYNVLHGGTRGWFAKEGNWSKRKQGVSNIIKNNMKADIYGFQEVITDNNQFDDIKEALPGYGHVGQPRSTYTGEKLWQYVTMLAATDEYNPIFYNQEKIDLIDS